MMSMSTAAAAKLLPKTTKTVSVAVVGVGLVGSEFVRQLQALPQAQAAHSHPTTTIRLVSLSSSKASVFNPDGIPPSADWRALLRASSNGAVDNLARTLAPLVRPDNAVVLVDNTASASVAETYPALLRAGVHVVTPNKKAFSGAQTLYDQIVDASRGGARFLHEATVGAGLPVLSTLKDLVATGDKVKKKKKKTPPKKALLFLSVFFLFLFSVSVFSCSWWGWSLLCCTHDVVR
jgi:homoserine dehydrogenase